MALVVDQQTKFKYFCRICKKGFMCGRALGGHMRAHGIGDESANIDDEDPASDWEERENMPPENKRNYTLRTNPNRFKSCRNCENCGKEFLSWKLFFEHGKCNSGDSESLMSLPESDGEDATTGGRGHGWSKKKRSFRGKVGNFNLSSEEDDLAAKCLMLLGSATVDPLVTEPEESCASASKEEERRIPMAASTFFAPLALQAPLDKAKGVSKGVFECKACKKVFNSHQALGGHRASHKKVKGCFASRLDHRPEDEYVISHEDFSMPSKSTSTLQYENDHSNFSKKKSKVHECSICHRVFSSGQALGGHKRCHWITSNSPETSKIHRFHDHMEQILKKPKLISQSDTLDLNLPAPPPDEMTRIRRDLKNPLRFEVCTDINLHSWTNVDDQHDQNIDNNCSMQNVEDEEDSKVKLANLSELKDMNMSGGSSPWLQVGIGSTTDADADP